MAPRFDVTYQLEEKWNDGEKQSGKHLTHSLGSLLDQCYGDQNPLGKTTTIDGKSVRYDYSFYLSEKDEDHEDYDEEDAKDDCESQPGVPEF